MTVRIGITELNEKVNGGSHYDHFYYNELSLNKLQRLDMTKDFSGRGKIFVVL
jgi:hypothetical protein